MTLPQVSRERSYGSGVLMADPGQYPDADRSLPDHALTKLRDVKQAADDAHAIYGGLADTLARLHPRLIRERDEVDRLTRDGATIGYPEGHPLVYAARGAVNHTVAEIARVEARHVAAKAKSVAARTLAKAVEAWIEKNRRYALTGETGPVLKVRKGADLTREIDGRRSAIREKFDAIAEVEAAPIPAAEAKDRARRQIEQLAAQATPDVGPLIDRGASLSWPNLPRETVTPQVVPGGGFVHTPGTVHDGLAVMAWLHRDAMVAAVERQIEAAAEDAAAIPTIERHGRLAALRSEILALEREEEALVMLALEEGLSPVRRPDADPRAVLQVALGASA